MINDSESLSVHSRPFPRLDKYLHTRARAAHTHNNVSDCLCVCARFFFVLFFKAEQLYSTPYSFKYLSKRFIRCHQKISNVCCALCSVHWSGKQKRPRRMIAFRSTTSLHFIISSSDFVCWLWRQLRWRWRRRCQCRWTRKKKVKNKNRMNKWIRCDGYDIHHSHVTCVEWSGTRHSYFFFSFFSFFFTIPSPNEAIPLLFNPMTEEKESERIWCCKSAVCVRRVFC